MTERDSEHDSTRWRGWSGLRRLLAFQIKLVLDAARDFVLSPVSITAFVIDAVRQTEPDRGLFNRLMRLGRRSDEIINLFEEHSQASHYTVDKTLRDIGERVEQKVERKIEEKIERKIEGKKAARPPVADT